MFTTCDPASVGGLPLNWLVLLMIYNISPALFWVMKNKTFCFVEHLAVQVMMDLSAALQPFIAPGTLLVITGVWGVIWVNDFVSVFPYIFTSTAHAPVVAALAFPLWVGHMLFNGGKNLSGMLGHFLPLGTPLALWPLMVIIEVISSLIRPFTLTIRLMANMVAGHLLMSLLGSSWNLQSPGLTCFATLSMVILVALELAVSIIQAYVFSLLTSLYVAESSNKNTAYS